MRYYISDLHFYHESLLTKMDCRGFENCDKMHEYMIERWNKKVRENDEVVILGDVSMERGKKTNDILQQLNGRLFLVQGNHDNYLEDRRFDATRFEWIKPYAELNDNKRKIILSHYPIILLHFYNNLVHPFPILPAFSFHLKQAILPETTVYNQKTCRMY